MISLWLKTNAKNVMTNKCTSNSAEETEKIGKEFAATLLAGDVVCLYGDLGAGKTTITKGIAKGLGITSPVTSPTFSLVRQYKLRIMNKELRMKTLYHIDLYRLEDQEQVKSIGIEEILSDPYGLVLIEWAEKLQGLLPKKRKEIQIKNLDNDSRSITFCIL